MFKKILWIILLLSNFLYAYNEITLTQKEKEFIKNHPTITLGTGDTWAPYIMKDQSGQNVGYDNDILTIINKVTGANFVQVLGDWSQMQTKAKNHEIDGLSTLGIFEKRKEWFNFSNIYITLQKMVLVKQKNPLNIQENEDLDGKTIIIHKGNMIDQNMADSFKNSKIIYADTVEDMLKQVIYGNADATFGNGATTYLLGKLGLPYLDFAYGLGDKLELAFAIRKDWPEAISILNKGLSTISEFDKIKLQQKWFGGNDSKHKKEIFTKIERAYLKEKKEITMCIDPDWMPFEKLENGVHIGISSDYFKIFTKDIGIPIKIIPTNTWTETLQKAQNRTCDIISIAMKTEKRKKYMNFTKPYMQAPLVLATNHNVKFINDFIELDGKSIGAVKGYAISELIHNKYPLINLIDVANIEDGLNKVKDGELFGFIDNLATIRYQLQTKFINKIKISGKFDLAWELSVAVRNDDLTLLSIFNKSIKNLSPINQQNILNKYFSIKYEKVFDYSLFWKIFAFLMIFVIIFYFRYRTIKKYNEKIERYFKVIYEHVLISSADLNGDITDISQALCRRTGYTRDEIIGKNHSIFRHKDTPDTTFKDMWETILSGKIWQGEIKNLNKDGSFYWANAKITPVFDKKGNIKWFNAIRQDITDKKTLEKLSVTDTLTQIPNRLYLDTHYKKEIDRAKRYNTTFSIIIIDIDFFKDVNDTYGHQIGDTVLINVANILKNSIRELDILGRWGGEEFMIICSETNIKNAEILANKIKNTIEYYDFPTVRSITCSFGVSQYIESDQSEEAFKRADEALYLSKNSGRNRVIIV